MPRRRQIYTDKVDQRIPGERQAEHEGRGWQETLTGARFIWEVQKLVYRDGWTTL